MIMEAQPMSHISALGYLVVRGPLEPWCRFGTDVLGAQLVEDADGGRIRFRTDDRAWRIEVQDGAPGPDALVALGFEVADEPALDSLAAQLQAAAVPVKEDRELAAARRVRRLLTFHDIEGNAVEAFVGAESTKAPFVSPRGLRFVCGDLGLGHAFMFSRNGSASAEFYQSALGFRLSDTIAFGPENGYFLHCNPRHHSIAFAAVPGPPPGLGHLMLEVDSLEAVGRALDIVNDGPYEVLMTLGEHSNDHMKSFYVNTPSGFSIEYGWNGRLVDDAHWKIAHYDAISVWGHQFVTMPAGGPQS
jgi:3,4-dihydroxy-9,10-secoandrosta-1,3,5(10)-triene-9,17-dione 4,5-dioxygenase